MTIKQQGGVFGRNPSFNDVKVDGDLSFADNSKALFGASSDLQIYHDGSNSYIKDAGTGFLNIGGYGSVKISNPDGTNVGAVFTSAGSVDLNFNGQNRLSTLVSGVSVTGNVIVASGNGIDFSATSGTGTSELFDDYEEGTWTATVGCTGNATTTTTVTGYYTKIGRQVTVGFRSLNNIDNTGLSGFLQIQGLPYACITGATAGFAGSADWSDLTYPAGVDTVTPTVTNGGSAIIFSIRGSGITGGVLAASLTTSGVTDIAHCTLTYFTA